MARGLFARRSVRYAIPFMILVVGGSFGLKEFAQIRYDYGGRKLIKKEDAEEHGVKMKDRSEVTLETEYEKIEKLDIDTWENKRGPRPWEEGNTLYEEAKQRLEKKYEK
ncbi:cytochrome c oxidase assembly protein COX16 homolog l(3)neo43 isoform X2 [Oratosquilla oratoria]|uniref:cytochrome c oxidase assembly protein COX16 homolog l(3)neo43 isoform X2 n=1 Tax=Oratosquilla oratoria TaxID=337810 RepID=UPI003F75DC79